MSIIIYQKIIIDKRYLCQINVVFVSFKINTFFYPELQWTATAEFFEYRTEIGCGTEFQQARYIIYGTLSFNE